MNNEIATIDANSLELIVKEKQLGILVTNARQVKEQVKASLPKYSVENYGEDNIAKAKADKAMLNKFSKEVNDKRLEIQREWMKPFDEFKAEAVTQTKEFETESQQEPQESTAQTAVDMYERRFRVVCTRAQLIALGDFMNDNNIYFEKL